MFWDKVSGLYDFFETVYNGKVYCGVGEKVAEEMEPDDIVLECACGTGAISKYIAPKCKQLIATDFSRGMLRQTLKKCRKYSNIKIKRADITYLKCRDNLFDKVVAGNVIHLLEEPHAALKELERVCKPGGKIIIPTYMNASSEVNKKAVHLLEFAGANFKRQFDIDSYKRFFEDAGYKNVDYDIVYGRMPCAVATITKEQLKKDIIEKYFQAWVNVDLEVVKQIFSENVVYSECYGPEYHGLSQIVKWFEDWNCKGQVLEWKIKRTLEQEQTIIVEWYFKCDYEGTVDGFNGVTIADFDQDMKIVKLCEYQSKAEHYYPYGM